MQKLGHNYTKKQIDEMIKQHDTSGDGWLDFDEFSAIFKE